MTVEQCIAYEDMAKLKLSDEERARLLRDMERLDAKFEALLQFDVGDAEPLISVLDMVNVTRDDVAVHEIPREVLLRTAPEQAHGYFEVPRTLEG